MFKIGDYIFDKNNNDRVQIVDISTVWGFVSYKVFNPATGVVYKLSADAVEAESRQVNTKKAIIKTVLQLKKKAYYEPSELISIPQMFPFEYEIDSELIFGSDDSELGNFGGSPVVVE